MTSRVIHFRVKDQDFAFVIQVLQEAGFATSGRTAASLMSAFLSYVRLGLSESLGIKLMNSADSSSFVQSVLTPHRPEVVAARLLQRAREERLELEPVVEQPIDWLGSQRDEEEPEVVRPTQQKMAPFGDTTIKDFDAIAKEYPKDRLIENNGEELSYDLKLAIAHIYKMIGEDMYGTQLAENAVRQLYDSIITYRAQDHVN